MPKDIDRRLAEADELIVVITRLAFCSGWPTALRAITVAKEVIG